MRTPLQPKTERYTVKLRIMGLRDLRSLGLLPVKSPFLTFDVNSLKAKDDKEDLVENKFIKTQPKQGGASPNICTVISFDVNLPIDLNLCPWLSCSVHDNLFKGLVQPTLGTFSIDLGYYIKRTRERLAYKFKKSGIVEVKKEEKPKKTGNMLATQNLGKTKSINLDGQKSQYVELKENKSELKEIVLDEGKPKIPEIKEVISADGKTILSQYIVVNAVYSLNHEKQQLTEAFIPDQEKYMPMGYDTKAEKLSGKVKKHYRYCLPTSLEESEFMDKNTFDEFDIIRGKRVQEDSLFNKLLGKGSNMRPSGKFKGWIDIMSLSESNYLQEKNAAKLLPGMFKMNKSKLKGGMKKELEAEFLHKQPVIIRLYVINLYGLPQSDVDSLSDPYIKVKLGDVVIDDVANADIYHLFELKGVLPGASSLHVQVWDYDPLVTDDLIGETIIDLENRFFSPRWRKLQFIPIETREIYHPLSSLSRGKIKLWLEIIPTSNSQAIQKIWEIKPKPAEGSFNWRMVYTIKLPTPDPTITFQIWDKDILSPSDFVAEATLNFAQQAEEAFENDVPVKIVGKKSMEPLKSLKRVLANPFKDLNGTKTNTSEKKPLNEKPSEKFVIELLNVKKSGYSALKGEGKLTLSFEIMPKTLADKNKVGLGRSEPNHDPWLPPPVGRFEWSWNPMTLFNRCVGPKARRKVCILICIVLCIALLIMLAPILFGNILGNLITK